ncbi:hypothetical protein REPUB_Repub17cG0040000 [Reevesia pubescens]
MKMRLQGLIQNLRSGYRLRVNSDNSFVPCLPKGLPCFPRGLPSLLLSEGLSLLLFEGLSLLTGVPPYTGRLGQTLEGSGKRRVFAIGNYINQRLLYLVHQWLAAAGRVSQ